MKKYKFIFWDMDGTMANTYEGVKKVWNMPWNPMEFIWKVNRKSVNLSDRHFACLLENIWDLKRIR